MARGAYEGVAHEGKREVWRARRRAALERKHLERIGAPPVARPLGAVAARAAVGRAVGKAQRRRRRRGRVAPYEEAQQRLGAGEASGADREARRLLPSSTPIARCMGPSEPQPHAARPLWVVPDPVSRRPYGVAKKYGRRAAVEAGGHAREVARLRESRHLAQVTPAAAIAPPTRRRHRGRARARTDAAVARHASLGLRPVDGGLVTEPLHDRGAL